MKNTKVLERTRTPEGYQKIIPFIQIEQNRCLTMMDSGILKINNNLLHDISKRSFSNVEIFFSEEKKRYLVTAIWRKVYFFKDITDMVKASKTKYTEKDIIYILNLDPTKFLIDEPTGKINIPQDTKTPFYTLKKFYRQWDCINYIIIG